MLSYAAAVTRRVRLGVAAFLINLRNPIQLPKVSELDQLSQGRLIAGVGLGAVTRLYQAYGLSPDKARAFQRSADAHAKVMDRRERHLRRGSGSLNTRRSCPSRSETASADLPGGNAPRRSGARR
jgi:alkanesulfonate monooxygenase SsuD/methylene tetrahydromethanopterin reductase-like flavin-dependent oxidoreductase (luciferase family)